MFSNLLKSVVGPAFFVFAAVCCTSVFSSVPTTQQAIDQLASDSPDERDAAESRLVSMGKDAIESLRLASSDSRPDVRLRALRASRRIALFRLHDVPTHQLAIADAYLDAPTFEARKLQLNLLFESLPAPDAVLTRLVPIETDFELRHLMLYRLYLGYREYVARMIFDDQDTDGVLTLLDGAATMWGQRQAADDALALWSTGHLDEQIKRWTSEQGNGNTADRERAASILCYLYRISGKYDQALKYARLSREQGLIFLVMQDQGEWNAAAKEQDDRWHEPIVTAAYRACFTRLSGHPQQASEMMSALVSSATPDTDASFIPSRLFLLNDQPEAGMNLLLPRHPSVAFDMRVQRGEIDKAIEIAERHPSDAELPGKFEALRQSLGEVPEPTTQPAEKPEPEEPNWKQWQAAVSALDQKQYAVAADRFGAIWELDRTHVDRLYLQGYALKAAGQTQRGEALMKQAELIPLGDPLARWRMAAQLDAAGLTDAAEQQRSLALDTGGMFDEVGFSEIWNTRAEIGVLQKRWRDAAEALDRLCLINLSSAVQWHDATRFLTVPALAHLMKARDARQHGDLSTAFNELKAYQRYLPCSSDMVIEWAPALDELGEHARADALFNDVHGKLDAICKKYPRSRKYLNDLAWMSACCGRHLDEALVAAQTAVNLKPDEYQTLDTLAEVHFRRGERQAAVTIEKVAISRSNDPYLQRQLKRFQEAVVPSTTQPGVAPE